MVSNGAMRTACSALLAATVIGVAGCGTLQDLLPGFGEAVPNDPGLYAVADGEGRDAFVRLDGDQEWELQTWPQRSNLGPGVTFVVRHPELAHAGQPLETQIHLRRVAWLRSTIDARGQILPVEGARWAVPDIDVYAVPLDLQRIGEHSDVVRVVPLAPLEPGLYSLELANGGGVVRARVGVQWSGVDQRTYSAAHCVDRYDGLGPRYRPCAEQTQPGVAAASHWLRLYLVAPDLLDGAQGRSLVVRGVVVNASEDERVAVPVLEAQVHAAGGEVLHSWTFDPGIGALEPGASASFRTETQDAPGGASSVHVRFAAM